MLFSSNSPCFLLVPNEQNQRILAPGKVLRINGQDAVIELAESVNLEPGSETIVYAHVRGKFLQQGAKICAMPADQAPEASVPEVAAAVATDVPTLMAISCIGEPVSAEGRGSFRVSIASCQYHSTIAAQKNCLLVDISPEGCAVTCPKPLTVGTTVDVAFTIEGITVTGKMKVQTVKQLPSGKQRFGLLAAEKKSPLRASLERLSMAMQRAQLKRISGAA